jgi:hypothetical protein
MQFPDYMTPQDIEEFHREMEIIDALWDDPLYGVNCELRALVRTQDEVTYD